MNVSISSSEGRTELEQKALQHVLRFSVSDLGSITGFNSYVNAESFNTMFTKYLYQDIKELQVLDCEKIGIELLTDEEILQNVISKLDNESQQELTVIQEKVAADNALSSNAKAKALHAEMQAFLERYVHILTYAYIHIYIYTHVQIYTHIHTIHIHIYVYIYIYRDKTKEALLVEELALVTKEFMSKICTGYGETCCK
jgi:hypothetical protein